MAQTSSSRNENAEDISFSADEKKALSLKRLQQSILGIPTWGIGAVVFVVALAFDFYRLGTPSIWFDEAFSVELARQPLPLLWHIIFGPEPNMELYYLFLHFWLGLTSWLGMNPTEVVVRFPSAVFAACSSVVVFALGRKFLGTLAGVVAAGLYLLNDQQLVYAQQTRSYSLQLLLICLAWYALFAALTSETRTWRWWSVYVLATALAIYAHLFSVLILLTQLVSAAAILLLPNTWRERARKQVVAFAGSFVAIGVLIIPMVLESRQGAKTGWLPIPSLHDLSYLFLSISGYSKLYLLVWVVCCALAVVAVTLGYACQYLPGRALFKKENALNKTLLSYQQDAPVMWSMLCWFVIPVVLSFIVSQGSLRLFSARYLVVIVPPICLLVALAVTLVRWRVMRIVLALIVLAVALYAVPYYYRSAQVEDWNSTSHWLIQRYQNGDGLVCYDNEITQGCQISVEYYLHAYPSGAHFTTDSPGAFSWVNYGPENPTAGFNAALDPHALELYAAKHPHIFFITGRIPDQHADAQVQSTVQWLNQHYTFVDKIVTRTVTIRLYRTQGGG